MGARCNAGMARDSHLAAEHAPFAYLGSSRNAHLCRHYGMVADFVVVGNLHQVVELHAVADAGCAHHRAVDACIGADFHVVADFHVAYLRNLLVAVGSGRKAESVSPYHAPRMQYHVRPYTAVVVYRNVGVYRAARPYHRALLYGGIRIDARAVANADVVTHIRQRTDIYILAYPCTFAYESTAADAAAARLALLVQVQKARHCLARVLDAHKRCLHRRRRLEIFGNEYYAGSGSIDETLVFPGIEKCEGTAFCRIDIGKGADNCIGVTLDAAAQKSGYLLGCKFHFNPYFPLFFPCSCIARALAQSLHTHLYIYFCKVTNKMHIHKINAAF